MKRIDWWEEPVAYIPERRSTCRTCGQISHKQAVHVDPDPDERVSPLTLVLLLVVCVGTWAGALFAVYAWMGGFR